MLRVSFVVDPPTSAAGAAISAMLGKSPQRDLEEGNILGPANIVHRIPLNVTG